MRTPKTRLRSFRGTPLEKLTKEKIEIRKTQAPLNVFFIVLEIPLRSIDVEIELTTEKQKQIFIIV